MSGMIGGLPSFKNIMGHGIGFDLGFTVEGGKGGGTAQMKDRWLGDPTARNYHWRLAASVTDLASSITAVKSIRSLLVIHRR
jgi:hypothetical protein